MNKRNTLLLCLLVWIVPFCHAQDDLMNMLEEEENTSSEPVFATFKTTRLINTFTNETLGKGDLDFRIDHRFSNVSQGYEVFFGFDEIADMRLAFEYGVTDKLMIGLGRSKGGYVDAFAKYRIVEQTTDNKIPVGVTALTNMGVYINKSAAYEKFSHRINYAHQVMISRKQGHFSFVLTPTMVHSNYVAVNDQNDVFALGLGMRYAFTKSSSIIFDYFQNFDPLRSQMDFSNGTFFPPIGLGYEIETGGHVFQMMFTNATFITPARFITSTIDNPLDGDVKFAFNISRVF